MTVVLSNLQRLSAWLFELNGQISWKRSVSLSPLPLLLFSLLQEAYLVQLVSETPQDFGVLEQTTDTLEILRTDLKLSASKIADLEREMYGNIHEIP